MDVRVDSPAGKCLEGQRRHEFTRGIREDDIHVCAQLNKGTAQLSRLEGRNRPADAKDNPLATERVHARPPEIRDHARRIPWRVRSPSTCVKTVVSGTINEASPPVAITETSYPSSWRRRPTSPSTNAV